MNSQRSSSSLAASLQRRTCDERPGLAVIVVSFNTRERTLACLASVFAAKHDVPLHVIVVDNDSRDGSAEAIEREFPAATVVRSGRNLGFARAVNLGVAHAEEEYLVLLNPDTIVRERSLAELLSFAKDHPEHGVYGGRTLRDDGSLDPSSCWGAPSMWSLLCFATGLSTAFPRSRVFDPESLGRWQRDTVREVPIVTGCLLLMRRRDFLQLGGLDERYFLYGEDAEFSLRAARNGHRPVIVPASTITHSVGASTGDRGRKMAMVLAGKVTMFRSIWRRPSSTVAVRLLLAGVRLRAALEQLTGRRDAMWSRAWALRSAWLPGYPRAEQTLFGREPDVSPRGEEAAA
ncbi:glycosyltransferase family 2 protein [Salinibacterium sp. SYSU T00001]|uniref:glycosyltransferase family 2 protein n=1 Tax=Homoserinimonas sedimenticola TaxID=2986805 RepID=UPI002236B3EE|nr:glycosyltransferase family 2 protein [Salinibacterium sedimenticola]MCW4384761.1 glycosyltransferase family 2 protein [Salinibacterium sedimenticola]